MMEKHITYTEKELKATLRFMDSSLKTIEFYLRLLKEQQEGKRSNIEVDTFDSIVLPADNLRRMIDSFNIDVK